MAERVFDVPGTVTLRDVSRPAAGETPEQRLMRLGRKAVIEGVQILTESRTRNLFATAANDPRVLYAVDVNERTCTCHGYDQSGACKHLGLALMERGMIDDLLMSCPDCNLKGGWKAQTGGSFSDWQWVTCRRCNGIGTVKA